MYDDHAPRQRETPAVASRRCTAFVPWRWEGGAAGWAQVPRLRVFADACCAGGGHQYWRAPGLAQFATTGSVLSSV